MPTSLRRRARALPSAGSGWPSKMISPESIGSSRLIARHSVDLPEPDGPITTTTSPRAIGQVDVAQDVQLAEVLVDAAHHDQRIAVRLGHPTNLHVRLTEDDRVTTRPAPATICGGHGVITSPQVGTTSVGTDMSTETQPLALPQPRTYRVHTYGCQMNVHDSERISGLLEDAGYVRRRGRGERRRGRLQHLCGPGERRQPAVRQPRPPAPGQGRPARHADRGRRLPGPEGPRRDRPPGALGRRRLRYPQHRLAAGAAGAGPAQRRGPGRDPRVAGGLPVDAADPAGVRRTPAGSRSRSAATTPARSASCRRCAARRRTAGRARSWPRCRRWSPRASSRSPCSGRTSTPTGSSSATGSPSASCCAPAATIDGLERVRFTSPHPQGLHRRRDRRDGGDARTSATSCTCRCSPAPTPC